MKDIKTILIVIAAFVAVEAFAFWYVSKSYYQMGRKDKESEMLSLKPDTTTKPSEPVKFEPRITTGIGTIRPPTDVEKKELASFIAGLTETLGGMTQENDSLRKIVEDRLSPFQVPGADSTFGVSEVGDSLRLYYWTLTDVVPLDRSASVLLTFLPFEFPMKEIIRYVPVDAPVAWYHPYDWMGVGALVGTLAVLIFF